MTNKNAYRQLPWDFAQIRVRVGDLVTDGKDRLAVQKIAQGAYELIDELVGLKDWQGERHGPPFVLEEFADAPEDQRFSLAQVATVREARDVLVRQWSDRLKDRDGERSDFGVLYELMVDALCVIGPEKRGCDKLLGEFFPNGEVLSPTLDRPKLPGIPFLRQQIERAKNTDGKPFDLREYFARCLRKAGL